MTRRTVARCSICRHAEDHRGTHCRVCHRSWVDAELRRLRESSIVHASLRRRPSWFWPTLIGSAICTGFGAGEAVMAFRGNGSIITGLLLAVMGLVGFSKCWPWMWEEP